MDKGAQTCLPRSGPMDCNTPSSSVLQDLWSLLKFLSFESVVPSSHLIVCHPLCLQSFPASGSFPMNQLFVSGGQSIGASADGGPYLHDLLVYKKLCHRKRAERTVQENKPVSWILWCWRYLQNAIFFQSNNSHRSFFSCTQPCEAGGLVTLVLER